MASRTALANMRKLSCSLLGLSLVIAQSAAAPVQAAEKLNFKPDLVQPTMTDTALQNAVVSIDKLAQKQIDDEVVPGLAIAIVYNDKIVLAKGYGVQETGKSEKVDADTVFQLASISKAVASTVVAAVVGEKIVTWDAKISDLDPAFALSDPWVTANLTIRDLFAHRSGLPSHAGDILEDLGYNQAQVLHRLRYQHPDSSFRSAYAYTNFGLTEGALAAARAANTPWEVLSEEKLYKPLGMTSTSSRFSDFWARKNKAVGHMLVDGKWVHKMQRTPDPQSPAGGVSSSANDMAKWMRLQIAGGKFEGKQIVDEKALAETHRPHMLTSFSPISGLPDYYGLGMNVNYDKNGRLLIGHSGGFALGAATNVKMIPAETLGICVLTNAAPIGVAEGIAATFTDLALNTKVSQDWLSLFRQIFADPAMLGETVGHYSEPAKSPLPALAYSVYSGTYENELYGKLKIAETANGLSISLGEKVTTAIKHYSHDTFIYKLETENLSGASALTFAIGAGGKAESVLVENLNQSGQGLFTRLQD